jgi:DNA (cytosine-5)-methyltransferase 1
MNHIELFSGCGGMSLGLKASNFRLLMANELSPMAATTFAYNFLDENLEKLAAEGQSPRNVVWLSSNFKEPSDRLRENPFEYPPIGDIRSYSQLPIEPATLDGKLVIGSIVELNRYLRKNSAARISLASAFGRGSGLDLVSGGPPCQSFSMAGLRQKDCDKNTLPWEFAEFVRLTQPKLVLLENVTGILRAFKTVDGKKFYAWYEVAKAIAQVGYIPICLHINARHAGVAQNRPRFILIGVRLDHYLQNQKKFSQCDSTGELFIPALKFTNSVKRDGANLPFGHLTVYDSNKSAHRTLMKNSFLSHLLVEKEVTVKEAIGDLKRCCPSKKSSFVKSLNRVLQVRPVRGTIANNTERNHSDIVRRRFRVYQILRDMQDSEVRIEVESLLRGKHSTLSSRAWDVLRKESFLSSDNKLITISKRTNMLDYFIQLSTLKHSQRALRPNEPSPATLSIPDDSCHYDELRVLTVREMARIQSFPDSFVFLSKETTGGINRKFEVPQYTQVGNAVPPLLAMRLGLCLAELL